MSVEHYYEVAVKWQSGRKGILSSDALDNTIEVVTPPEFPKGIPGIWSPEHLLVAAVNSCLMTTFLSIAENSKIAYEAFESKAVGKLELVDGKYMISEITLMPTVTITDAATEEKVEKVLEKSEANCLISNSVKAKIIFTSRIKVIHKEVAV